ncbi:MAG: TrbG/VirB9 family P-type conjugative transfer protein [Pseudomonadota bacterium]
MMRTVIAMGLTLTCSVATARVFPTPSAETPRVQTVEWRAEQAIVLTALPETAMTVMLEPGERIVRATLAGSRSWSVAVSAEADTFQVTPQAGAAPASLSVETDYRKYEFALETGDGLQAAYLVRVQFDDRGNFEQTVTTAQIDNLDWSYRLRGHRSVRPASIRDNGAKTVIEYAPGQALPAVFAIGPSGNEEVVDGYMRDGKFVIDRVHRRLVFRIDKEKATARRNKQRDGE